MNIACSRAAGRIPNDPRWAPVGIALQVACFFASLRITESMDRLQLEGAYNTKTGEVRFSWRYLGFRDETETWVPTGLTHFEKYEQGGRTCLLALMGYTNPYNATFCR